MSTSHTHWVNLSREFAMARFANTHALQAPRSSTPSSLQIAGNMGSALDDSRTLAGMLLAAVLAALLVVADQLIDTWTDGHLLAAWVALWSVAFAALALLAPPLRQLTAMMAGGFYQYIARARAQREEERMWQMASHDPRVLEEIEAAMQRQQAV